MHYLQLNPNPDPATQINADPDPQPCPYSILSNKNCKTYNTYVHAKNCCIANCF